MPVVYKIYNSINDKIYIGSTKLALKIRWNGHRFYAKKQVQSLLYIDINSMGIDNFFIEIIEECDISILKERELFWAQEFNSFHPNGYNINRPTRKNSILSEIYPRIDLRVSHYEYRKFKKLKDHGYSAREVLEITLESELPITLHSKTTGEPIHINEPILSLRKKI
jgi:group I intron endonuclease